MYSILIRILSQIFGEKKLLGEASMWKKSKKKVVKPMRISDDFFRMDFPKGPVLNERVGVFSSSAQS